MVNKIEIPQHIAIVMDGNGRWARARGLPRIEGHRQGANSVEAALTACGEPIRTCSHDVHERFLRQFVHRVG